MPAIKREIASQPVLAKGLFFTPAFCTPASQRYTPRA
jgi:hypothetical protein